MKHWLYTGLILLTIQSCIDPLEISNDENRFELVIDGKITQGNTAQKLYLSRTTGYGYYKRSHVAGAQITLFDSKGNSESYLEDHNNNCYMLYGDQMERIPGESYHIEIILTNDNIYRSSPQVMPDIMKADTVIAKPDYIEQINDAGNVIKNYFVSVFLSTPIKKNQKDFYFIWRSDEAYSFTELQCHPLHSPKICYIKRSIENDELKIFSSEDLDEGTLEDFLVASVSSYPTWEHFEKHFYNVAQHSITKEAYEYWETVKKIAQPSGSIFDTPPAPIPGNIYNADNPEERVLGFFEVSAVDTVRTRTFPDDLSPITITDRCPWLNWQTYNDPPCCNCLSLDDSYVERPDYWGE